MTRSLDAQGIIREVLARGTRIRHMDFIACGGSMASMFSGHYLIAHEGREISSNLLSSNEFVHATPAHVGPDTICVVASLKATPESVDAVLKAKSLGAVTIVLSGSLETAISRAGDYALAYTVRSNGNQATSLKLAFELLYQQENYSHYEAAMAMYPKLDELIENAVQAVQADAEHFARQTIDKPVIQILASGSAWGGGYIMAHCHLMEMQWRHGILIHSGEYFHGPFETTDLDTPVVLLKSCGATRPLDERAERFIQTYAGDVTVIDAAELGLKDFPVEVAQYFNSVLYITVCNEYVSALARLSGHDMKTRRYMWKFDY